MTSENNPYCLSDILLPYRLTVIQHNSYTTSTQEPTRHTVQKIIAKETVLATDYNTGKTYKTDIEIFSLKNISLDCAVGVKFLNSDDVYPYINDSYEPRTLGDFKNTISFGDTRYEIDLLGMPIKKRKRSRI